MKTRRAVVVNLVPQYLLEFDRLLDLIPVMKGLRSVQSISQEHKLFVGLYSFVHMLLFYSGERSPVFCSKFVRLKFYKLVSFSDFASFLSFSSGCTKEDAQKVILLCVACLSRDLVIGRPVLLKRKTSASKQKHERMLSILVRKPSRAFVYGEMPECTLPGYYTLRTTVFPRKPNFVF
jgi:hypothetical protein